MKTQSSILGILSFFYNILIIPPVEAKRRSRYRGPVAPGDGTGVAPRGKTGTSRQIYPPPEDGTGVNPVCVRARTGRKICVICVICGLKKAPENLPRPFC